MDNSNTIIRFNNVHLLLTFLLMLFLGFAIKSMSSEASVQNIANPSDATQAYMTFTPLTKA